MNNTSMIRISNKLKEELKTVSVREGRTLEWLTNDAIDKYLHAAQKPTAVRNNVFLEPTYISDSQDPQDKPKGLVDYIGRNIK